jgi:VIT1/CCC1 family predicted Fe2+/Mn2+ transporter
LTVAVVLSAVTLFVVGSALALLTGRSALRGGLRMVAIAAVVGLASHLIGRLIGEGVSV